MKKSLLFLITLLLVNSGWTQTFTNFTKSDGLGADGINAISIDLLGNKWFGTLNGVTKFDGITWTNYTTENGLVDNLIYSLASDKNGAIWIGTNTGASMFDGEKWITFGIKEGINYVRSLEGIMKILPDMRSPGLI